MRKGRMCIRRAFRVSEHLLLWGSEDACVEVEVAGMMMLCTRRAFRVCPNLLLWGSEDACVEVEVAGMIILCTRRAFRVCPTGANVECPNERLLLRGIIYE